MIVGLVAITPAAGFVNGWGAIAIGAIGSSVVYVAYNYLSRVWPFRIVDDTLGVIYTHGIAGLTGGLLVGLLADSHMILYFGTEGNRGHLGHRQRASAEDAALRRHVGGRASPPIGTFILLKLVGLLIPLRMSDVDMETGDLAVHGHEVYPSDVPSLGYAGHSAIVPTPPCPRLSRRPGRGRGTDDHRLVRRDRKRHRRARARPAAGRGGRLARARVRPARGRGRSGARGAGTGRHGGSARGRRHLARRSGRAAPCGRERLDTGGASRSGGAGAAPT